MLGSVILSWSQGAEVKHVNLCSPAINESYQERLLRLEGDKESLVLQVSVLTDQVEAQGEKIRDLESALQEHHQKLVSTEEMLQQELLSRTSLEGEKLDLMDEVSQLKLTMVGMEESHNTHQHTRPESPERKQNKAEDLVQEVTQLRNKVEELEDEKSNYERKLRVTKSLMTQLSSLKLSVERTQLERQHWEERWRSAQVPSLHTWLYVSSPQLSPHLALPLSNPLSLPRSTYPLFLPTSSPYLSLYTLSHPPLF
ncbi:unnamed protein product [Boreogadus saida]